jgi:hypothetical protein
MKITLASLAAIAAFACPASADVVITLAGSAPEGSAVKIAQPGKGMTSSTSARFKSNKTVINGVAESDRDFGQTFTTGDAGYFLDRITVQLGNQPITAGVFGAKVSVQLFEVSGKATVNDNGTKTDRVAEWSEDPRVDDFIEGETYTPLGIAREGRLPAFLIPGQLLVLNFRAADRLKLKPNTQYGFLFMFDEAGPDRSLSFSTAYWSEYEGGHAIRRDGATAADTAQRTTKPPTTKAGTKSDVYSDVSFWVEGSDLASAADVGPVTASANPPDGVLPLPKR